MPWHPQRQIKRIPSSHHLYLSNLMMRLQQLQLRKWKPESMLPPACCACVWQHFLMQKQPGWRWGMREGEVMKDDVHLLRLLTYLLTSVYHRWLVLDCNGGGSLLAESFILPWLCWNCVSFCTESEWFVARCVLQTGKPAQKLPLTFHVCRFPGCDSWAVPTGIQHLELPETSNYNQKFCLGIHYIHVDHVVCFECPRATTSKDCLGIKVGIVGGSRIDVLLWEGLTYPCRQSWHCHGSKWNVQIWWNVWCRSQVECDGIRCNYYDLWQKCDLWLVAKISKSIQCMPRLGWMVLNDSEDALVIWEHLSKWCRFNIAN